MYARVKGRKWAVEGIWEL